MQEIDVALNEEGAALPPEELKRQIMSANVPKNEREWWASREIDMLRDTIRRAVHDLPPISCGDGEFFYSATIRNGLMAVLPKDNGRKHP